MFICRLSSAIISITSEKLHHSRPQSLRSRHYNLTPIDEVQAKVEAENKLKKMPVDKVFKGAQRYLPIHVRKTCRLISFAILLIK